jgi:uncharacterized protein with LGFP repeats
MTVNSRWGSGRIRSITVHGTRASVTLTGPQFRGALGLKSSLVWINENLLVTGEIRALYDSLDCSPGLPVTRASERAGGHRQYFENGTIYIDDVHHHSVFLKTGKIRDEYWALGGISSFLGWPTTGVLDEPYGALARFIGGVIYDSSGTGAHETHGIVRDAFLEAGGPEGSLGLPTTDVQASGDDRSQQFEHGSITCNVGTGKCAVH